MMQKVQRTKYSMYRVRRRAKVMKRVEGKVVKWRGIEAEKSMQGYRELIFKARLSSKGKEQLELAWSEEERKVKGSARPRFLQSHPARANPEKVRSGKRIRPDRTLGALRSRWRQA